MNIGIDLGSTYSTVSKYNPATGRPEPMTLAEGEPASIPSEVAFNEWEMSYTCGKSAKDMAGQDGVKLFRAFKMLLVESKEGILREHGYSGKNSPRAITAKFLGNTLRGLAKHEADKDHSHTKIEKFENVVICMPELWADKLDTQDGRGILLDILRSQELQKESKIKINNVRVVTEPEAASAFIAHNYEAETHKPFNGHLLLIDYGGGTLDLTLTQVESDGKGSMEITYRDSGGDGQNHLDENGICKIGKAGIAYIQNVLQRAMVDAGVLQPGQPPVYDSADFKVAYNRLETALKDSQKMDAIEDVFSEYDSYRDYVNILTDELDNPLFAAFPYGSTNKVLRITYPHLFLAYQEVIEGVLQREIEKINVSVEKFTGMDPRRTEAGTKDNFKIALVGGFSSFYLVKQQIAEIYNFNSNPKLDKRTKGISASARELAISMGASLLAASKVVLRQTARYSIGIASDMDPDTKEYQRLFYGITYRQPIQPNKIYYIRYDYAPQKLDAPQNWVPYGGLKKNLKAFVTESSHLRNAGDLMPLTQEMLNRLNNLPEGGVWHVGFSMDENGVISLHVTPRILANVPTPPTPKPIPLDSFQNLFALSEVKRVNVK